MRESKAEPIKRIGTVIQALHHGARVVASAVSPEADLRFQRFVEKIHENVKQFEFELRTELTRLAAEPAVVSDTPVANLSDAFKAMLEAYQKALATNISAHTRAMITRQFEEVQKAYEQLVTLAQRESEVSHTPRMLYPPST
jgi:hypothetical protein